MDATEKTTQRLLEWFRNQAPHDGVRIYDDNDGVTIGVEGHIQLCKLVAFLLHGDVTRAPGPPPEQMSADLAHQEVVQAALGNVPAGLANDKPIPERKVQ